MKKPHLGILPKDKTAVRKGRVKSGWHRPIKSAMQLQSEKNRRNSW